MDTDYAAETANLTKAQILTAGCYVDTCSSKCSASVGSCITPVGSLVCLTVDIRWPVIWLPFLRYQRSLNHAKW